MKNVLITGSNGQLGNEMRVLSEENKEYTYFLMQFKRRNHCTTSQYRTMLKKK